METELQPTFSVQNTRCFISSRTRTFFCTFNNNEKILTILSGVFVCLSGSVIKLWVLQKATLMHMLYSFKCNWNGLLTYMTIYSSNLQNIFYHSCKNSNQNKNWPICCWINDTYFLKSLECMTFTVLHEQKF